MFPFNVKNSPDNPKKPVRISGTDPLAVSKMSDCLHGMLLSQHKPHRHQLVVLCIGTDRSTGDALGPLTGTRLAQLNPHRTAVYGSLAEPVHALNLAETLSLIKGRYPLPLTIAVDACLGRAESVGAIELGLGPLRPGAGVRKELPCAGEMYVSGIVNIGGFLEHLVLQNTRLDTVVRLAEIIAGGLHLALQNLASPFLARTP